MRTMSASQFTESTVEQTTLAWLKSTGWQVAHGPGVAPDRPAAERMGCGEVLQER